MLRDIQFKFGGSDKSSGLSFEVSPMNVIVGPNNSGKSLLLREIAIYINGGKVPSEGRYEMIWRNYKVLKSLRIRLPPKGDFRKKLYKYVIAAMPGLNLTDNERMNGEHIASAGENSQTNVESWLMIAGLYKILFSGLLEPADINDKVKFMRPEEYLFCRKLFERYRKDFEREKPYSNLFHTLFLKDLNEFNYSNDRLSKTLNGLSKRYEVRVTELCNLARETLFPYLLQFNENTDEEKKAEIALNERVVNLTPYVEQLHEYTKFIDGSVRFELVKKKPSHNLRNWPENHFMALLQNEDKREKLRQTIREVFGWYLCIDTTDEKDAILKISKTAPADFERSRSPEALNFFNETELLEDQSDGVKSFVGIMSYLISYDDQVLLIDEPDAFLAPPLANKTGRILSDLILERGGNVLAATHSSEFLMGCVDSGVDLNIIRLTHKDKQATARFLEAKEVSTLMESPIFRATKAIEALFHESAVICEGNSDRVFYHEINERLNRNDSEGIASCKFIDAGGKGGVAQLVRPLRKMGLPAAAVLDLDAVSEKNTLPELLDSVGIHQNVKKSLGAARSELFDHIVKKYDGDKDKAKKELKRKGMSLFSTSEKQAYMNTFFEPLAKFGIFIVPVGEVEQWLPEKLGGISKGNEWLRRVFDEIGKNERDQKYLAPTDGDVWEFMRGIANWLSDPNRSGIPAE